MRIEKGGITNDFIEMNKRQYVIPVYQRNYEWSEEQCRKLFCDIIAAHEKERSHFCGSIVYSLLGSVNKIDQYVIIDGQQRLTTIYILIKAMMDESDSDGHREKLKESLLNKDKFNHYTTDQASKLKLKPIKSDNNQLLLLMDDRLAEMRQDSGIARNYRLFRELVRAYLDADPERDVTYIYDGIERLTCALIKLEDEDDNAQEIFERINSTGIPLSLADKIRNYALMANADQDRLYEEYWLPTEQMLGTGRMSEFFLDYLNMKSESFIRYDDAYEAFKRIHSECYDGAESMLRDVYHYARQYSAFLYGSESLSKEVNLYLAHLRQLKQSTIYLFLFHVFDDLELGVIDETTVGKILRLILSYSVRRLVCEIASNSLRGLYKTLYSRVFNMPENKRNYYDAIVSFMLQLTSRDAIPDDKTFANALGVTNLYRKNVLCRFLLVSIENRGKERIHTDELSIEHIMPQNRHLSPVWQRMLGEEWERVHTTYLHTLGNLALTGYNSELGDKPFAEKKRMLQEQPTHITELYKDILSGNTWNEQSILERCKRLTEILMQVFSIDPPQFDVDFSDPRYSEYTLEDPSLATSKQVNYYVLLGERVLVNSYAQMVRSVATKLYTYESSVIERMARNEEPFHGWINPSFAYRSESLNNPYKLSVGNGLYISGIGSAYDCICFIRALMKAYGLSIEDDFTYSARSTSNASLVLDRVEVAKKWCEKKATEGVLGFSRIHSDTKYIRFTTPYLDSIIPTNEDRLCAWKSSNYYFYEILNHQGQLYIQLMFFCMHLTSEMKIAFKRLADALGIEISWRGYTGFFFSSKLPNKDDDTPESISDQLDVLFKEVNEFEKDAQTALERQ